MATSGSYNFALTRDDIINGAFRQIGVLGEGQSASSTRISQASDQLNLMIDEWEYMGIGLWLVKELVLFVQKDQVDYYIGPTGTDYVCLKSDYAKTEIATAAAAAAGTITVDSDDAFTNGDYIGIETDNGDIHWTTINGAPVGDVITLTSALDYAAAVDNHVYGFTNLVQRPLEIVAAYRRNFDEKDTPMDVVIMDEWRTLTDKYSESIPTMLTYEMLLTDILVHIWPEPTDMKDRVHIWAKYPLQDFDAAADDWDFPRGWGNALKMNLAMHLAPEYGRKVSPELAANAARSLGNAMTSDRELGGFQLTPDLSSYKE